MAGALLDDARMHAPAGELRDEPPPCGVRRRPDDAGGQVDRAEEVRERVGADAVAPRGVRLLPDEERLGGFVREGLPALPEIREAFGSRPEVWLGLQMQYDLAQAAKTAARIKVHRITASTGGAAHAPAHE